MIIRQGEIVEEALGEKPVWTKALLTREAHTEAISITQVRMAGRCCQQMTCDLSDRVYYLLSGQGEFQVGQTPHEVVREGDLVYIRKGEPYSFSGNMTYLVINVPAFVPGSDITID
jgi:mannose-6-phosphate isomerase-like protein (cupin superfamily)